MSGERLAPTLYGMSQSKVSRIETGRLVPSAVDISQMLDALSVDAETREALLTLTRLANAEYQDVRASVRRGLHLRQKELAALEITPGVYVSFCPRSSPAYSRCRNTCTPPWPRLWEPAAVRRLKGPSPSKLERQVVLHDDGKRFGDSC